MTLFWFFDSSANAGRKFTSLGLFINDFDVVLQIGEVAELNFNGDIPVNEAINYLRGIVERLSVKSVF
jgi:hypothetical protein